MVVCYSGCAFVCAPKRGVCVAAYFQLLRRNPDFARLWIAQVISLLGDWFNVIALSALVSEYSGGSGMAISGLLIARFLPPLVVSPLAGVLIDRFDRKRLLILSDVLRAVIILLLLFATGPDMLWLIYLLTVIQFCLSALFEPGRSAIMPSLLQADDLLKANTLGNVTWSVMLAFGAMAGGAVTAALGTAAALVIDALTFLVSAWFITQIKTRPEPAAAASAAQRSGGSFREGLRYLAQHPASAALLFVKLGLSIGNVDSLIIAYGTILFVMGESGTGSLGVLYSAFGIGAVLGPALLNRFSDGSVRTLRRLVIVGYVLVVAGWVLLGGAAGLWVAALALIVRSMGGSINWTYSSTMIQMGTPDHFLGRVFSLDWVGFSLAQTISTLITGLLLDTLGGHNAPVIALGTGMVSIIPLAVWWLIVHRLEHAAPEPAAAASPVET
jgi:MFS family permease